MGSTVEVLLAAAAQLLARNHLWGKSPAVPEPKAAVVAADCASLSSSPSPTYPVITHQHRGNKDMADQELPSDIETWRTTARRYGIDTDSVHSYRLPSASNASMHQFLLLRAYWPHLLTDKAFNTAYKAGQWIRQEFIERATKELNDDRNTSWKTYLESFGRDFQSLDYQGTYALARYYQHLCTQNKDHANKSSRPKVYFTPRQTRSMARAAAAETSPSARPKEPHTPPQNDLGSLLGGVTNTMGDLLLGANKDDPFSTPLSFMASPSDDADDEEVCKAIEDEQIVNTALVSFLNALTLHSSAEGEWSLYRMPFVVRSADRSKVFEARVDGVFRNSSSGTGAIIEVKPMPRHHKVTIKKIRMQETAQMAAWIAAEPPKTATMPRSQQQLKLGSGSKSKKAAVKPKVHRRLLVSQDRHQIFLIVATFDDEYVHYISGDDDNAQSFLVMQEYGPYDVGKREHMDVLGGIMLAISMQGGIE
ncbi:hypothetical protein CEP52_015740 [Fusarium oligoseptatum]|uniref:Uncharacterized protein n=1 Tax=Fusarium oligoseptatum TaxID=2604345 RepID=A0A428SAF8_9HYPO|nr:hypothetical protein CEP52_015740 [Fusarium oligoseptatum]